MQTVGNRTGDTGKGGNGTTALAGRILILLRDVPGCDSGNTVDVVDRDTKSTTLELAEVVVAVSEYGGGQPRSYEMRGSMQRIGSTYI
jgi:CO dehydrogenase nickel-insertion accessory protein CooC1